MKLPVANVKFANVQSCGCKAVTHITNRKKQDITGETFIHYILTTAKLPEKITKNF